MAVSRAKDSFIVVSDMSHFDSGDDGTPSGTLVQMMFARPDSEIVMALPSAISSTLNPDGHSKCSTYGQSNCSTPATVN